MFEREMINSRVREGIQVKKAKDPNFWKAHCGRHKSLTDEQVATLKERVAAGEKIAPLAREYGISRTSVYAYLKAE